MNTIGIRAAPSVVTFAVYDAAAKAVRNIEEILISAAFELPDALKFVRSNLLDVLREYAIEKAGIRTIESTADRPNIVRIQIEGVIQESFASSGLKSFYIGQISSISARLGIDRKQFKPLIAGETDFKVANWKKMTGVEREAVLCAIGAVDV